MLQTSALVPPTPTWSRDGVASLNNSLITIREQSSSKLIIDFSNPMTKQTDFATQTSVPSSHYSPPIDRLNGKETWPFYSAAINSDQPIRYLSLPSTLLYNTVPSLMDILGVRCCYFGRKVCRFNRTVRNAGSLNLQ
jgi:hypothetical protein